MTAGVESATAVRHIAQGQDVATGKQRSFWAWLYSAQLTLWLIGVLIAAMALGTVIPQRGSIEVYRRAFGEAAGGLIARTSLSNLYGSWWFIALLALLASNLAACVVKRAGVLLRSGRALAGPISAAQVRGQRTFAQLTFKLAPAVAAEQLTQALRRRSYQVTTVAAAEKGATALRARRGRARLWGPVIVHLGLLIVLLGAAYGRFPSRALDEDAFIAAGDEHRVKLGKDSFSIRLLDAGTERTPDGTPSQHWAKAQIMENGQVIRDVTITPNHPLRYHGTNVVLNSLFSAPRYAVEITKGESVAYVPVILDQHGQVSMMETVTHLKDPPWLVWISDFREGSPAGDGLSAQVRVDESGAVSPARRDVGWVGGGGLDYKGVHFELVGAGGGKQVQLGVHRDLGVPVVWGGFGVILVGCLLAFFVTRRDVAAVIVAKSGGRTSILFGASAVGFGSGDDNMIRSLGVDLDARQEVDNK